MNTLLRVAIPGIFLLLAVSGLIVLLNNRGGASITPPGPARPQVVATIFPLADWLKNVGGEHIDVHCLVSGSADPHHFEPTMQDASRIGQANAFFAIGLDMDPWAEKLVKNSGRDIRYIDTSKWITPQHFGEVTTIEGAAHDHHGHDHSHEGGDPHFWLDPERAMKVVLKMAEELAKLDPAHAADYDARAERYIEELSTLDEELTAAGPALQGRKIVTFHDAYGYLFRRLGIEVAAVVQTSPGVEPGAREITEAVRMMKQIGQRVVFVEPQSNQAAAELLARELGGTTRLLDPMDTSSSTSGKTYLERLRYDIDTLRDALTGDAQ